MRPPDASDELAAALGGACEPDSHRFVLRIDGIPVSYTFNFDQLSGLESSSTRVTWSSIVIPVRRFPLWLHYPGVIGYRAAPRALADKVLDETYLIALRRFGAIDLRIHADSKDPSERFIAFRFIGWMKTPETAYAVMRLITLLPSRLERAVLSAQRAHTKPERVGAPFREMSAVTPQRDVVLELFFDARRARLADRKRRRVRSVLRLLVIALLVVIGFWARATYWR